MSNLGHWVTSESLPVFRYTADQDYYPPARWDPLLDAATTRHWVHLGNRRITLVADNEGLSGLWDEYTGCRWLTEPSPHGTGITRVTTTDGTLSTAYAAGVPDSREFGPTFSRVTVADDGVTLSRTVLCPEGEQPWVLIRVRLTNTTDATCRLTVQEEWAAWPASIDLAFAGRTAEPVAVAAVEPVDGGLRAGPLGAPDDPATGGEYLILQRLGDGPVHAGWTGAARPVLTLDQSVDLPPRGEVTLHFRFGLDDGSPPGEAPDAAGPEALYAASLATLRGRLPTAHAPFAPQAAMEIPWHAALLTGGACRDGVLGGHTLNQGSAYAFRHGFNGAARDPLQHALPLVYLEPDLALSVLRNTCAWGSPDGDLPYMITGGKQPLNGPFRPSDQNLWALWLAAEYAAATGDLAAFAEPVSYHPVHSSEPVPLAENLRRQYHFFRDVIGRGRNGHVRIRNSDWNDLVIAECGVPHDRMIEEGESVLNSAMAAWVLPVYAALADQLDDHATAADARRFAEELRTAVASDWNGRWFRRAHAPGTRPIGDDDLWLEVQPWAILCGAATTEQSRQLLDTIDTALRTSPIGAVWRWSPTARHGRRTTEAERGAIWYALNMTLIWAAAEIRPELARDEWRRMSLAAHATAYPDVWEGTLSGPDAFASPLSDHPGRTWSLPDLGLSMQAYPVANLHSHAQPLLAYLRLLGVEPTASGELSVRGGGRFTSRVLTVQPDGSGTVRAAHKIRVRTRTGRIVTGQGVLTWDTAGGQTADRCDRATHHGAEPP